ncbi:MAG: biosynthetic-type acetolactate synthase large subunit [Treponema sp.]|jgi:acetolactate synthase-1/2/3 large subunit|nr:biosynthetic-type acetolactate synthase large subunit [Treponema sp.]
MQFTGARILVETLIEQGVDTIFGYPGGSVLHIYDELYRQSKRIRHILVSHEQHAAHAADGYARSSGKPGVCLATSGPGATNLVTGIATAAIDSVPIVAITGNVSVPLLGKDSFQEVDITGITMPIVKHNWIVKDVKDLAEVVREAFIVAVSGRPGPVLIDIPKDVTAALCEWKKNAASGKVKPCAGDVEDITSVRAKRLAERGRRETFTADDIEKAAALLMEARRPVLYAGGGVILSGAEAELKRMAEILNAPVALSLMGMGAFPHDHRLCTGLIGMHGTAASNKAVQKADLLVAIGARFSDRVTSQVERFAHTAKILHIDIDPAEINKNVQSTAFVTGDVKAVLERLIQTLPAKMATEWNGEIEEWKAIIPKDHHRKAALHPRFVIQQTASALGEPAIAVTDVGQHQIWTAQFYPFNRPRSFLSSGGMGTMGYGMGAAMGAKAANPGCPVALFSGDGCFRMNCAEMATLVRYSLPVLIIVFNNHTLGMVRQWQNFFYEGRYSETDLDRRGPDFIKLAAAYDVPAFRADSEESFMEAVTQGITHNKAGRPALIEAVIDKDERVLPMVPGGRPIDEQIM